jgi:hypothetical protein
MNGNKFTAVTADGQTAFSAGPDYKMVLLIAEGQPTTIRPNDTLCWNRKERTLSLNRSQLRTNRVLFRQGQGDDDKLLLTGLDGDDIDLLIGSIAKSAKLSSEISSFSENLTTYIVHA